ncbi:MAG: hypothetical protein ACLFM8_08100 [Halobacteriales archaeon]
MQRCRRADADWKAGRSWCLVYPAGEAVADVRDADHRAFLDEDTRNPVAFPSVLGFETGVEGATAPPYGLSGTLDAEDRPIAVHDLLIAIFV